MPHAEHVGQELSDCLLYLLRLADVAGIDLPEAALKKIQVSCHYPHGPTFQNYHQNQIRITVWPVILCSRSHRGSLTARKSIKLSSLHSPSSSQRPGLGARCSGVGGVPLKQRGPLV